MICRTLQFLYQKIQFWMWLFLYDVSWYLKGNVFFSVDVKNIRFSYICKTWKVIYIYQLLIAFHILFLREVIKGHSLVVFYVISNLQDVNGLMVMVNSVWMQHMTSCLVGCLREVQNWCLPSVRITTCLALGSSR